MTIFYSRQAQVSGPVSTMLLITAKNTLAIYIISRPAVESQTQNLGVIPAPDVFDAKLLGNVQIISGGVEGKLDA